MNKPSKITVKLVAAAQILAIVLLASCTPGSQRTICHATGDTANPYQQELTVTTAQLAEHVGHPNDIIPAPASGCPTVPVVVSSDGKITICHATGTEATPYNEITVSVNGLNGHGTHAGDIIPAPEAGCPTTPLTTPVTTPVTTQVMTPVTTSDGKITICHATGSETNPYNLITVDINGLNGHDKHADDIIPAPANGCPTIPVVVSEGKVTICHATGIEATPYDKITVTVNGLDGHGKHAGDIIPAPEAGCPTTTLVVSSDGKITICHATSSETNPYNQITVSVNGLNGHGKHAGDIIPAPAAGCPTTPVTPAAPLVSNDGKITICHATSSAKNPYNLITVSINGLNGHDKHPGDIIPAPAAGCPTAKP